MTEQEKRELAEKVRSSNFIEPTFEPEYLEHMNRVDRETCEIYTREGKTKVYIHRAKTRKSPCPVFINIHGGGFVRPHMPCNTYLSARIADEKKGIVADIDYRLAPEYPYPAAFNECYDVARWAYDRLQEWDSKPSLFFMGGHSAGASLTLSVNMRAQQTGDFRVQTQVLDFGAFDMVTDPGKKRGIEQSVLSAERMQAFSLLYTDGNPEVLHSPYVSASFAPDEMLKGLPDTLILTAGNDPLRFEAEELGMRLIAQGVKVTMQRFADSNHGFTVHCTGKWREAQRAILDVIK